GTGNIDDDPDFCMETNYEFNLLEGSPCIDTGDPTQTDSDGTRVDMGCYPSTTDIKYCEGNHWNWVSFPRLDRDDDDAVDAPPILDDFLDWPFDLVLKFEVETVLEYEHPDWTPTSYDVYSSYGYKLDPQDNGDHYLPSQNRATRLPADWELRYTLPRNTDNWMGYWLPWTQNIEDAFGEFWDIVKSVEAEDWYYEYSIYETPTSSPTNKNMVYGKAYIVVFDEDVEEFYWTDDMEETEQRERMESEYFSYNDLPSYEVIDVMDIPQNVLEIGVFEDDVCVGAVVVQDTCEQILVYSGNVLRDPIPFSFEIVTNNREAGTPITNYRVLNKETGLFEERSLISGQQKSSVIMFGNLENPQNNTPSINDVVLHGNYPNPFNPETNISFSLPQEKDIDLTVYNLKGQKVRTLYTGITSSGEQSVVWNGKDDDGKHVGSGLYFYKLTTEDKVYSKKMLLLK
nr:T9SS type A sorting domain-containing protein [Candidatus Cloacimonadota bacterium]